MFAASANDFSMLFVSIELITITFYILVSYQRHRLQSLEAGVKYIVLADNFVMMFIFWELVGVSSYLLIGFWFEKPSAADAAKKAFLTNRVGDFGFLIGILIYVLSSPHQ